MNLNIAAVVDNLGPSQNSFYLVKQFNKALSSTNLCVSAFIQRFTIPVATALFSCKSVSFISGYHHNLIATSISDANLILNSNNASSKFLYLWDLEWLYNPTGFINNVNILRDNRLKIIARSESHAQMIENYSNKSVVGIVDDWNLDSLIRIIQEHGNK